MFFPIYDVSASVADRPEALGSKEKFWLTPQAGAGLSEQPHLFKVGRPNTGENWAEKVCCEILKKLEMPCAEYHFAICAGKNGVISERFFNSEASFLPANTLLSKIDSQYDGSVRFHQLQYKLLQIMEILRSRSHVQPPLGFTERYGGLSAHDFFIGYLIFDAFVGNTDRHHENWGVVVIDQADHAGYYLAPSFDHASSLGRDLSDKQRSWRLSTRDTRATVEAYADRARSAFFGPGTNPKALTSKEVVAHLMVSHPETTQFWVDKISSVEIEQLKDIFDRIMPNLISEQAVQFALRMLKRNQQVLREVARGL
jgi:hypothetical protein